MRRRTAILLCALGAVAVGAFCYWGLERVDDSVDVEASGPARANPFYASEQTLDLLGVPTVSVYRMEELPPTDHALLFLAPDPTRGQADVDALWAWMAAGGHLLVVPSPPVKKDEGDEEDDADDPPLGDPSYEGAQDTDGGSTPAPPEIVPADPLLQRAQVTLLRWETPDLSAERSVVVPGWDEPLRAVLDPALSLSVNGVVSEEDWIDEAFYRIRVGQGQLTILADAMPFDNDHIGEAQHARLLWALIQRDGPPAGALVVVDGRPPSLWSLLAKNAGLALWSGAALLVVWLWGASRRLGPRLLDPPPTRRSLAEQMDAVGNFMWRRRQTGPLLAAGRALVSRRLARLHPGASLLEGEEQVAALAEETGASPAAVRLALIDPFPTDAAGVIASVAALQALAGPEAASPVPSRRSG